MTAVFGLLARRRLTARAYAKVNLDLRVLGERPDGYHELRTVFQTIKLHDTLVAQHKPGPFVLRCRTSGVPLDENNLVWKAAVGLWRALGRDGDPRNTVVTIEKGIPVEAGLGGGSSDAAAGLRLLARFWGGASMQLLRDVAVAISADVPFFLSGGTALGLGRGEEIYPLVDLPRHWIVLVHPRFGVSTREAYAWYDDDRTGGVRDHAIDPHILPVPWPTRAAQMINDLEPPVVRRHPEIGAIKAALREAGAIAAAMSGSGSAVFGLFRTRPAAGRAAKTFGRTVGSVLVTRTLPRGEYERLSRPALRRV